MIGLNFASHFKPDPFTLFKDIVGHVTGKWYFNMKISTTATSHEMSKNPDEDKLTCRDENDKLIVEILDAQWRLILIGL